MIISFIKGKKTFQTCLALCEKVSQSTVDAEKTQIALLRSKYTESFTSRIGGLGEEMEIMTEAFNQNQPQQTEAKLHLGLHLF